MLGDFDEALFWENDGSLAVPLFLFLTVATTVIMLNVLITIVGESYARANDHRDQLSAKMQAEAIIELEAKYLWPWSESVTRRGKPCRLVHYPAYLVALSGMEMAYPSYSQGKMHETLVNQLNEPLVFGYGHYPGAKVLDLSIQVLPEEFDSAKQEETKLPTEREVLRQLSESMSSLTHRFDKLETALHDIRQQQ